MSEQEKVFIFPDPKTKDPDERFVQRIFEIFPGAITWMILLGLPLLAFLQPIWVAVFVIAFDLLWIHKSFYISLYTIAAYKRLRRGISIDWYGLLKDTENIVESIKRREREMKDIKKNLQKHSFFSSEFRKIRNILKDRKFEFSLIKPLSDKQEEVIQHKDIVHIVLFPTATEGAEIIEPAIRAVKESDFPNEQIIIVLATEENEEKEKREEKIRILRKKFKNVFRDFLVTVHKVKDGEMKCKASNATYAAKELCLYLNERDIDYKRVILSNFDCDTVCHKKYFSALTFLYTTDKDRLCHAYQPLPMYNNNIWDTNAIVRIVVFNSTFWHMFKSTRDRMVTFSSHSEPFDTIVKLNFWPVNMISEDSIIYWKGYSYFDGKYTTKIVPLPVSMDAALADTYGKTLVNQYKQLRRWAYGMENLALIMRSNLPNKNISFWKKWLVALELVEGHVLWATAPIILGFMGWLPLWFGGAEFKESVLAHNLPFISGTLMSIAMIGLLIIVSLNFLLLPPKPKEYSRWRYSFFVFQWLLVPFMGPFFAALPAIDAQTRLLLGKYFGSFWVTEKIRKKSISMQ
ncbi:MAG: glycosyltransferase family 2 protein [Candidatus Moraniibacteriota bacterium]|nr:MAG: glycosyltransferase family 2 protein [Candidatus Moranbacteria bacterium]